MTSYLAITAHWITQEWELRSDLMAFSEIEGSHTGENLGEELYDALNKYGICNKVSKLSHFCDYTSQFLQTQNLTSDNVTVNDKSIQVLGKKLRDDSVAFNAKEQRSQ